MHLCLFEDARAAALFPLTRTRPAYDLRLGLRTLLQAARDAFGRPRTVLHARPLLRGVTAAENNLPAPVQLPEGADVLFLNGRFVAEEGPALRHLREARAKGEPRLFVTDEGGETTAVAAWVPGAAGQLPADLLERGALGPAAFSNLPQTALPGAPLLGRLPDLLDALDPALRRDIAHRAQDDSFSDRSSAEVQDGARLVEGEGVFVAPGATVRPGALLSAADGPVFVGKGAVVMEHAVVRGPVVVGPKSEVKPGAHIEASALGVYCKVGGEVHGSVLHSLSNKAHGGYLGDSYLGRWCNLGAGTITSNLKNDYGEVSLWNGRTDEIEPSGRQFAGLFMGDHSKSGIGTSFNTGTVVDVFCNLFGPGGFPPRYVAPFSWGGPGRGFEAYRLEKALRVAEAVMARRGRALTGAQRRLLEAIAEEAEKPEKAETSSGGRA